MIKYSYKNNYKSNGHKVSVQNDAETTSEALELWCQFMRGATFFIDEQTEEEMLAALQRQVDRVSEDGDYPTEDQIASLTDALESAAEKY